jgi:hypothetical protein
MEKIKISNMDFIPNGMFKELNNLLAKDDEETVNVLHSYSVYETRKPHMSKEQTEEFKYPCAMNINVKNEVGCIWYSNTNENGHFHIPKLIFGRFKNGVYNDIDGKYGLSQDCRAIVDNVDKLQFIEKAMFNDDFIELMKMTDVGGLGTIFNHKIISLFRKDFYKYFI